MPDPQNEGPKSPIEESVRLMFRRGGYADAVGVIKEHLALAHDDVPAYELLADALRYSGDKAGAAAALATASDMWAKQGMSIQSIAAQKRVIKLGVEPDFSAIRSLAVEAAPSTERVPTPLFDDLSDEEFREVAEKLDAHSYEPGESVVEEGSPGDSMFIVASGTLDVVTGKGAAEIALAQLGPSDFFGESSLLSGRPRTATIRARTHVECLVLSRAALEGLVAAHPRIRGVMEEFNRQRAASTIDVLRKRAH